MATDGRTIALYIPAALWRDARGVIDPARERDDKEVEAELRFMAKKLLEAWAAESRRA